MCVPLWQVELDTKAFSQIVKHLRSGSAALLHHQAQHLCHTALKEGVLLSALYQLLVDLVV